MRSFFVSACAMAIALAPSLAHAQDAAMESGDIVGSSYAVDPLWVPTPEAFTFELRAGVHQPLEFDNAFGGDLGPIIALEIDAHIWRVPFLGPLAIGVGLGWAEWTGQARNAMTGQPAGSTGMSMINGNVLAIWRIDGLARYVGIPLVFTGKFGLDMGYWQMGQGTTHDGFSIGMRYAGQVALELDFLEPRAARRLDDEWGINHTELFFEIYGSTMGEHGTQLRIGDDLAWVAGLGLTF